MKHTKGLFGITVFALGLTTAASTASADSITFTGSVGNLAASVIFATEGTDSKITLSNTSTRDVLVPADVLTAVFFDIYGDPVLTPVSALLPGTSSVFVRTVAQTTPGGNVGGEWAWAKDIGGANGANQGISSSGLGGVFGGSNFNGPDLEGPAALDGLQYGITSYGDNKSTGNQGVTRPALINYSVVFTLSNLPTGFDPTWVSNVSFQYGTMMTEPNFPGCPLGADCTPRRAARIPTVASLPQVPEPASMLLLGTGLLGAGWFGRKRRK